MKLIAPTSDPDDPKVHSLHLKEWQGINLGSDVPVGDARNGCESAARESGD